MRFFLTYLTRFRYVVCGVELLIALTTRSVCVYGVTVDEIVISALIEIQRSRRNVLQ